MYLSIYWKRLSGDPFVKEIVTAQPLPKAFLWDETVCVHARAWVGADIRGYFRESLWEGGEDVSVSFITDFVYCYYFIAVVVVAVANSAYGDKEKETQVIWTFVLEPTRHEHLVLGFESRCEGGGDAPRWGRIRAVEVCGETARSCKCTALAAYKRELALWFQKDWHIVFIHSRGSWGKRSGWVRSSGFATTSDIPERVPDCGPAAKDNGYSNCERRLIQEQSEYFCELCVLWNIIRLLKS